MKRFVASERGRDVFAVGIIFLVITILFADVLFLGSSFYRRDLALYHYPLKYSVRDVVRGGEFPYWNPYYAGGQPLAANPQNEVFYPPTWITFLVQYDLAFRLHIMLHFYLGALGAYLFLRSLKLRVESAVLGALMFVLGGLWYSLLHVLPFLFCTVWIPWIALFARRALDRPILRDAALT